MSSNPPFSTKRSPELHQASVRSSRGRILQARLRDGKSECQITPKLHHGSDVLSELSGCLGVDLKSSGFGRLGPLWGWWGVRLYLPTFLGKVAVSAPSVCKSTGLHDRYTEIRDNQIRNPLLWRLQSTTGIGMASLFIPVDIDAVDFAAHF